MALARIDPIGDDRRDVGLLKFGRALMWAMGVKADIDPNLFLPIEAPKREMTPDEALQTMLSFSRHHNGQQVNRNPESLPNP